MRIGILEKFQIRLFEVAELFDESISWDEEIATIKSKYCQPEQFPE